MKEPPITVEDLTRAIKRAWAQHVCDGVMCDECWMCVLYEELFHDRERKKLPK